MTTLALVEPCERCNRFRCPDEATCDAAYIVLLEERVARWQELVRVAQERTGAELPELRRGGRGRLPGEMDS